MFFDTIYPIPQKGIQERCVVAVKKLSKIVKKSKADVKTVDNVSSREQVVKTAKMPCMKHEVAARLSRIEGHVRSVRNMVDENRSCEDVMIQLSAIRASVAAVTRVILENHITECVANSARANDLKPVEKLRFVIQQIMK